MHDSDNNLFAEQLLNAALAVYAAEEPRAGLEQRLLARLAEVPQPSAWVAWRWLPAGALTLVAVLALALLFSRREIAPPPAIITSQPFKVAPVARPPSAASPSVASAPSPLTPVVVATALPAPSRAGAPRSIPAPARAAQFPTPGSLTEQERLLMRYLESSPRAVLMAWVRNQGPLPDLQVRDVEVPMLELKPLPDQSGEAADN